MLAVFVESKIWINTLEEEINFQQLNQVPDKHVATAKSFILEY